MTKLWLGRIVLSVMVILIGVTWEARTPSYSQTATNDLSQCLVLKTTGEDRLVLVRWISFALLAHPALSADLKPSQTQIDDANQKMSKLFVDLLTVRCLAPAKALIGAEASGQSFKDAFSTLGQVSAQEIFGNEIVVKRTSDFMNLVDMKTIETALK